MSVAFTVIDNINPDIEEALKEHRIKIGEKFQFSGHCYFGDAVTVGDNVVFADDVTIGGHTIIEDSVKIGKKCKIGEGSFIGKNIIIADNVSLPKRTYIESSRIVVNQSENFTSLFSTAKGIESFLGSDRILMYDPEEGQDYETSMSFKEFIVGAKVRQRLRIKQEEKRNEFLKQVSAVISILEAISYNKTSLQ